MSAGYNIRRYEPDDLPSVLRLLEASLAGGPTGERTADFFRWKHHDNPFGTSYALVAERNGELVAFRTFMRWRFTIDGRVVKAVRAVDTATHPDHQGKGLFKTLTLTALDDLRTQAEFVFNTPNANSLPGYMKMGWEPVGVVPIHIRPLRPLRFARGLATAKRGAGRSSSVDSPLQRASDFLADEQAVNPLLGTVEATHGRLATERTVAYLQWRYGGTGAPDYRVVRLMERDVLAGVAIGRLRWRGGLVEFTLCELLTRTPTRQAVRRLLAKVNEVQADHVATHLPGWTWKRALGSGYVRVPGQGMLLTTRVVGERDSQYLRGLQSWSLSLGDLELF